MARVNVSAAKTSKISISSAGVEIMSAAATTKVTIDGLLSSFIQPGATNVDTGKMMLPVGCRLFASMGVGKVFVLEDPPQSRTIEWLGGLTSPRQKIRVSLPWTVYVIGASGTFVDETFGRLYFRKSPLDSINDRLLLTPCGSNNTGNVCFGSAKLGISGANITGRIAAAIRNVWSSGFYQHAEANDADVADIVRRGGPDSYATYKPTRIIASQDWHDETKKDPAFGMKFPWPEAKETLRDVVNGLLRITEYRDYDDDDYYDEDEDYDEAKAVAPSFAAMVDVIQRVRDGL